MHLLKLQGKMSKDGKKIRTKLTFDGVHGNVMKAAAMGVGEMLVAMSKHSNVSIEDLRDLFNKFLDDDINGVD